MKETVRTVASLLGRTFAAIVKFWNIPALGEVDPQSPDRHRRRLPYI